MRPERGSGGACGSCAPTARTSSRSQQRTPRAALRPRRRSDPDGQPARARGRFPAPPGGADGRGLGRRAGANGGARRAQRRGVRAHPPAGSVTAACWRAAARRGLLSTSASAFRRVPTAGRPARRRYCSCLEGALLGRVRPQPVDQPSFRTRRCGDLRTQDAPQQVGCVLCLNWRQTGSIAALLRKSMT
jgi:hypothetical protein